MLINWETKTVKLSDLRPYERNPRTISRTQFNRLKGAISKVGFHTPLLVTHDLKLIAGHQRIKALKELGVKEVVVRFPDRPLTDQEFQQVLIQSNISMGEFDMDILASDFDIGELIEWGIDDKEFDLLGAEDKKKKDNGTDAIEEHEASKPHTCPACGNVFES